MNTTKQALIAILSALWISGLWNELHSWEAATLYLLLTLLMIAVVAFARRFKSNRLDDDVQFPRRRN